MQLLLLMSELDIVESFGKLHQEQHLMPLVLLLHASGAYEFAAKTLTVNADLVQRLAIMVLSLAPEV